METAGVWPVPDGQPPGLTLQGGPEGRHMQPMDSPWVSRVLRTGQWGHGGRGVLGFSCSAASTDATASFAFTVFAVSFSRSQH